jgi:hypothetical protein
VLGLRACALPAEDFDREILVGIGRATHDFTADCCDAGIYSRSAIR